MKDEDVGGDIRWSNDPAPPKTTGNPVFSGPIIPMVPISLKPIVRARSMDDQQGSIINQGPQVPTREAPEERPEPDHATSFGAHRGMVNTGETPDWTAISHDHTKKDPAWINKVMEPGLQKLAAMESMKPGAILMWDPPIPVGIPCGIDVGGRVVIPKEMRKLLEINAGDSVQLRIGADVHGRTMLYVSKHQPGCVLCGKSYTGTEEMVNNRPVCSMCLTECRILAGPSPSEQDV